MFFSSAFAQTTAPVAQGGDSLMMFAPMVLIFVVFYFFLIRPQQKRQKEHQKKIEAVRRGDQVVTAGGILGKVVHVRENIVEVEIAAGMSPIRVLKSTLADITDKTEPVAANKN